VTTPRATYRLQLQRDFDFAAAARLVPYLAQLGISHLYSSPILAAVPGSTHGYDVVDPRIVNPELGGEDGLRRLVATLRAHDMGLVVDIVPNHMAITPGNPWWWDVLENGRASRFARTFDVDWDPPEPALRDRILMPILGDHYGRVLEAGQLSLVRDGGSFRVTYGDHVLPIAPRSVDALLGEAAQAAGSDELAALADGFATLPPSTADDSSSVRRRHRDKEVFRQLLARLLDEQPAVAEEVDRVTEAIDHDPDRLDALLERQNYRLAYWRTADRDLGYRRFFDVATLAGLRMEDEQVFEETHATLLRLLREGVIDGLRVDHPDGLRDPAEYLGRLRQRVPDAWIVVEKILEAGEPLRPWPVAGTTGYDFIARTEGLFVDPDGETAMTRSYTDFTGETQPFDEVAREGKLEVMRESLGSELNRLTGLALRVCEGHRRDRDHTRHDLHEALRETAASFPVYRSYVRAEVGEIAPEDVAAIEAAIGDVRTRRPDLAPDLFDLLADLLLLRVRGPLEAELVMRFQQFTGSVQAKGVEDTAFYRYLRLVSLNEVGGDPGRFGTDVEAFHAANVAAAETWPAAMLAGSTHDTKRSEDVRLRIHLLSEIPDEWAAAVARWSALADPHRRGDAPDRQTEWLLYQTLVGTWPIEVERLTAVLRKSMREARRRTAWTRPDAEWEDAVEGFVRELLADGAFVQDLQGFVARLRRPAVIATLAATLLRLTCPGVPDVYQGTESPDNSLVDPDNRRPVDFARHRRSLERVAGLDAGRVFPGSGGDGGGRDALAAERAPTGPAADSAHESPGADLGPDGGAKLWLIRRTLETRGRLPGAFEPGAGYRPLAATGAKAGHLVAFERGDAAVVVVPRLVIGLADDWSDTTVDLPRGSWCDVLSNRIWAGSMARVGEILGRFPVALLVREEAGPEITG